MLRIQNGPFQHSASARAPARHRHRRHCSSGGAARPR